MINATSQETIIEKATIREARAVYTAIYDLTLYEDTNNIRNLKLRGKIVSFETVNYKR